MWKISNMGKNLDFISPFDKGEKNMWGKIWRMTIVMHMFYLKRLSHHIIRYDKFGCLIDILASMSTFRGKYVPFVWPRCTMAIFPLTHCGLVTHYGDITILAQLTAFCLMKHAIIWINVDYSSVKSRGIHLRVTSEECSRHLSLIWVWIFKDK